MVDPTTLYPLSPAYGRGMTRRRIRLTGKRGCVEAELEDHAHGMRCRIEHDGRLVTGVASEFLRIPMNTCLGAGEPLADICGMPVGADFQTFFAGGRARLNCTHMFDLAWLANAHAMRGETVRDYLVEIPDEQGAAVEGRVLRDGEVVLRWLVLDNVAHAPEEMEGRHLLRGFTRWATDYLEDDALEAALVFQKGYFVIGARRLAIPSGPLGDREKAAHVGICHGYGAGRIEEARRLENTKRDFSDHPERLLRFL